MTELDVSGNLLSEEVTELKKLTFLKKLSISNNQIKEMWELPSTLEFLNISQNFIEHLNPEILAKLTSLKILDISNNSIVSLEGIQSLSRLKRLLAFTNNISSLEPLRDLTMLVEIDLASNFIANKEEIVEIVMNKKDILVFNLKQTDVCLKALSAEELLNNNT